VDKSEQEDIREQTPHYEGTNYSLVYYYVYATCSRFQWSLLGGWIAWNRLWSEGEREVDRVKGAGMQEYPSLN